MDLFEKAKVIAAERNQTNEALYEKHNATPTDVRIFLEIVKKIAHKCQITNKIQLLVYVFICH